MLELRPYQAEAKQAILTEWDAGHQKTLLVLPTGTGKTVVFASVTENQVEQGHRVLIMAHRGELLSQAADKLKEASGLESVLEKAESSSLGSPVPVTIGSVQSLSQERRLAKFPRDYFQDIVVDEAHHCLSDSYQRVLEHFPGASHLLYPQILNEGNPDERELGLVFGLELLSACDQVWVFGERISSGMEQEIREAQKLDKKIRYLKEVPV